MNGRVEPCAGDPADPLHLKERCDGPNESSDYLGQLPLPTGREVFIPYRCDQRTFDSKRLGGLEIGVAIGKMRITHQPAVFRWICGCVRNDHKHQELSPEDAVPGLVK